MHIGSFNDYKWANSALNDGKTRSESREKNQLPLNGISPYSPVAQLAKSVSELAQADIKNWDLSSIQKSIYEGQVALGEMIGYKNTIEEQSLKDNLISEERNESKPFSFSFKLNLSEEDRGEAILKNKELSSSSTVESTSIAGRLKRQRKQTTPFSLPVSSPKCKKKKEEVDQNKLTRTPPRSSKVLKFVTPKKYCSVVNGYINLADLSPTSKKDVNTASYSIYIVRHILTNRCYIGHTKKKPRERWEQHIKDAQNGSEILFHQELKKDLNNFKFGVLKTKLRKEEVKVWEELFIRAKNGLYLKGGMNSIHALTEKKMKKIYQQIDQRKAKEPKRSQVDDNEDQPSLSIETLETNLDLRDPSSLKVVKFPVARKLFD